MTTVDPRAREGAAKPTWRAPKLEELGNVRDFVRSGTAVGKSHLGGDGTNTSPTAPEQMN